MAFRVNQKSLLHKLIWPLNVKINHTEINQNVIRQVRSSKTLKKHFVKYLELHLTIGAT